MGDTISTIADICGILGFIISLFAASQIIKLKQQIKGNNNSNVSVKGNVGGQYCRSR